MGGMSERVTIMTVTHGRERFLPSILACVRHQTYDNIEWIVLDDSPEPSPTLSGLDDPRFTYIHLPERKMPIGEKRNYVNERARGEVIVQFDDDDYYAPNYIARMMDVMAKAGADFLSLHGWFVYDERHKAFGYRMALQRSGLHYLFAPGGIVPRQFDETNNQIFSMAHFGYGFSYLYKRKAWAEFPIEPISRDEDMRFAERLSTKCKRVHLIDTSGLCLHFIHSGNVSTHAVQYLLPPFQLKQYFPGLSL